MTSRIPWNRYVVRVGSGGGALATARRTQSSSLLLSSCFASSLTTANAAAAPSPEKIVIRQGNMMIQLPRIPPNYNATRRQLFFSTSSWGDSDDDIPSLSPPSSSSHDDNDDSSSTTSSTMSNSRSSEHFTQQQQQQQQHGQQQQQEPQQPTAAFCSIKAPKHQRVWFARGRSSNNSQKNSSKKVTEGDADDDVEDDNNNNNTITLLSSSPHNKSYVYWRERVVDRYASTQELLELELQIEAQETTGGRLRKRQLGVLHEDPVTDMQLLIDNYTVKAVASALRDREDALQYAAVLAAEHEYEALVKHLRVFHPQLVLERRASKTSTNITQSLHRGNIELIRKALMRMPRTVTTAHDKRAAVVIALCTVNQVPCVLLEKRAKHLSSHPNEVCLPGGMVCDVQDQSIVSTCLREMKEEIGGLLQDDENPDVLGVFRCNWGEIHHLVNVAVTPVVCFLGELPEHLTPTEDEVAQVFTVPLDSLIDKSLWIHREGLAPIFVGAHEVIWGLSGYILERFAKDILMPNSRPTTLPRLNTGVENVMPTESDDEGEVLQ